MRRDAYDQAGGYRGFFRFAQDADQWMRMNRSGRIVNIQEVLHEKVRPADSVSEDPQPDQALLGPVWHTRRLQQRAWLDHTSGPPVVDDKPLSLPASLLASITDPSVRRRHAELVPAPGAVVHLDADPETVVARLRRRAESDGRTIRRHAQADGEGLATREQLASQVATELAIAREAVEVLAGRGVAVTAIDATRPVADTVGQAAETLRRIPAP